MMAGYEVVVPCVQPGQVFHLGRSVGNQQKWDTFVKERSRGGSTLYVSAKVCGGQLVSLPGQHISRSNAHLTPKRRIRYY